MSQLTHAQSRRLYSWWWDSHISPKNSKWLQDNLADIDGKVRAMIRLIEEDAESFAQRAEMFFRNRPELMKLVEEFYRAYRALAERYDHATGALRQAHRKMAEAFPNEIPLEFPDEAPSGLSANDEWSQHSNMNSAQFDPHSLQHDFSFPPLLHDATIDNAVYPEETDGLTCKISFKQLKEIGSGSRFVQGKVTKGSNSQEEDGKYSEYKLLQKEISRLSKENQDLNYQIGLESERAEQVESEVQHLKETFAKVKSDKEAAQSRYQESMSRVSYLEHEISRTQEEIKKLNSEILAGVKCLSSAEEKSLALQKTNHALNLEMDMLKQKIIEQKEEILRLEKANVSMNSEVEMLRKRVTEQMEELNSKSEELEKIKVSLKEEHREKYLAEMTCHYIKYQEKEKALAAKIQTDDEKMKNMMLSKENLEEQLQKAMQENHILNEQKLSSSLIIIGLQNEMLSLTDSKARLQDELDKHVKEKTTIQYELTRLKEDRNELEGRYNELREEIQAVNLNIQSLLAMTKDLRDGNLELKETIISHEDEKNNLQNLKHMGAVPDRNEISEMSCGGGNEDLEKIRDKIQALEESCYGKISIHQAEKALLVSQSERISREKEKLSKRNVFLENSLSDMNFELDALRVKIKSLEQSCQSLQNEKLSLLSEKFTLVGQVEHISQNLGTLEHRCVEIESKHSIIEKEKHSTVQQVADLQQLLILEKERYSALMQSSKRQVDTLSNNIFLLQEEVQKRKEELEVEQMQIMDAKIEIFILQRCLCDLKEENLALSIGSQKHQEMLRHGEKLILELKQECLIQDKRIKLLAEDSKKLKEWIHRMTKLLKTDLEHFSLDGINDELLLKLIVRDIRHLLQAISEVQDEKQLLLLEKTLVMTILQQFGVNVADLRSEKTTIVKETAKTTEEFIKLKNVNHELVNVNERLKLEIQDGNQREEALKVEVDILFRQLSNLQEAHCSLQLEISKMLKERRFISKTLQHLKNKHDKLQQENSIVISEAVALDCLSIVLKNCVAEKGYKLELLTHERKYLFEAINDLDKVNRLINEKIVMPEARNELVSKPEKRSKKLLGSSQDESQKQHRDAKFASLLNGIQFKIYNAESFKAMVNKLITSFQSFERNAMVQRNSLREEIMKRDLALDKLKEKLVLLEGEKEGLITDLNTYSQTLRSLTDDFSILEEHTISLALRYLTRKNHNKESLDAKISTKTSKETINCYTPMASPGLMNLQTLHAKMKELQKLVIDTGSIQELERLDSNASLELALREIEWLTPRRSRDKHRKKPNNQQKMKDVQLDIASDSAQYGDAFLSHEPRKIRNTDSISDPVTKLYGTPDASISNSKQKSQWVAKEKDVAHHEIEKLEESGNPSLELVAEKELGVDKLVLSNKLQDNKEWNVVVMERLTSDCKRLLSLQASVIDIQKNIGSFEKMNIPTEVELDHVKLQLKDIEETISKLIDINSKLAKKVEDFSIFPDNQAKEKKESGRRSQQISERITKVSAKIGKLELEVQNIRHTLLKAEEEYTVNRTKVIDKKTGILLKEYIYGKRDIGSGKQKKKGSSCNCIRPKAKGD